MLATMILQAHDRTQELRKEIALHASIVPLEILPGASLQLFSVFWSNPTHYNLGYLVGVDTDLNQGTKNEAVIEKAFETSPFNVAVCVANH